MRWSRRSGVTPTTRVRSSRASPRSSIPAREPRRGSVTRHELVVGAADASQRLDTFVASHDVGVSRSRARHLIDSAAITVDGAPRKPGYLVRAGDRVLVAIPAEPSPRAEAEDLPLEVL